MQRSGGEKDSVFGKLLWCAGWLASGLAGGGGVLKGLLVQVVIICHASFSVDSEAGEVMVRFRFWKGHSGHRGHGGGVTQSGSHLGASHLRGRPSREDGKGSSPALHLKDCSLPAKGSQTKSRMAHLVRSSQQPSSPGASPSSFQPLPTPNLFPSLRSGTRPLPL